MRSRSHLAKLVPELGVVSWQVLVDAGTSLVNEDLSMIAFKFLICFSSNEKFLIFG